MKLYGATIICICFSNVLCFGHKPMVSSMKGVISNSFQHLSKTDVERSQIKFDVLEPVNIVARFGVASLQDAIFGLKILINRLATVYTTYSIPTIFFMIFMIPFETTSSIVKTSMSRQMGCAALVILLLISPVLRKFHIERTTYSNYDKLFAAVMERVEMSLKGNDNVLPLPTNAFKAKKEWFYSIEAIGKHKQILNDELNALSSYGKRVLSAQQTNQTEEAQKLTEPLSEGNIMSATGNFSSVTPRVAFRTLASSLGGSLVNLFIGTNTSLINCSSAALQMENNTGSDSLPVGSESREIGDKMRGFEDKLSDTMRLLNAQDIFEIDVSLKPEGKRLVGQVVDFRNAAIALSDSLLDEALAMTAQVSTEVQDVDKSMIQNASESSMCNAAVDSEACSSQSDSMGLKPEDGSHIIGLDRQEERNNWSISSAGHDKPEPKSGCCNDSKALTPPGEVVRYDSLDQQMRAQSSRQFASGECLQDEGLDKEPPDSPLDCLSHLTTPDKTDKDSECFVLK